MEQAIKPKQKALSSMDWIDSDINTGRYNYRCSKDKRPYNKCNIFLDDIAKKGWGIELPRLRDDDFSRTWNKDYVGNEDKPMSAVSLDDYFTERARLRDSGVQQVPFEMISKLANKKKMVVVVGQGHATLAAPSKKSWPLIYRSDQHGRGKDKRTKVGIADSKVFQYFLIDPPTYNKFSKDIKSLGYSDIDIYRELLSKPESDVGSGEHTLNEKYTTLHKMLRK